LKPPVPSYLGRSLRFCDSQCSERSAAPAGNWDNVPSGTGAPWPVGIHLVLVRGPACRGGGGHRAGDRPPRERVVDVRRAGGPYLSESAPGCHWDSWCPPLSRASLFRNWSSSTEQMQCREFGIDRPVLQKSALAFS